MSQGKQPKSKGYCAGTNKPRVGSFVAAPKVPRHLNLQRTGRPVWSFRLLDTDGPWCWKKIHNPADILKKMADWESMTFTEIFQGRGSHEVPQDNLTPEAIDRLNVLGLDMAESVTSMRLTSASRLICLRQDDILQVLWWDPEHTVAKSNHRDRG